MYDEHYAKTCELKTSFTSDNDFLEELNRTIKKPEGLDEKAHKEVLKKIELQKIAARMNTTPERVQAMRDYANRLKRKYPFMSDQRIQRKTADYFKIKLT